MGVVVSPRIESHVRSRLFSERTTGEYYIVCSVHTRIEITVKLHRDGHMAVGGVAVDVVSPRIESHPKQALFGAQNRSLHHS